MWKNKRTVEVYSTASSPLERRKGGEAKKEFDHWYANEPYIKDGVWKTIEVKPFKVTNV